MSRDYVYKLTHDANGAPCIEGDILTLAICKPMIRATARVGDFLFGFAASSLRRDNRLVYIARVTGVEVGGDYYEHERYAERPDRVYVRGDDGRFSIRPDAAYHDCGTLLERDVGAFPEYEKARVLVSDDFRYFGTSSEPPIVDLSAYPAVRRLVHGLGQGHRVNHPPEVSGELRQLRLALWSMHAERVVGAPSDSSACGPDGRTVRSSLRRGHPTAARRATGESNVDSFAFGHTAEVVDEASGAVHRWTLVSSTEADLAAGRLSVDSPVGRALRARPVGETVVIEAPRGERRLRIERLVD